MNTFIEMGLAPELLRQLMNLVLKIPLPYSKKPYPSFLSGQNDLVVLAQTGTGKTAAFGLPVLQLGDTSGRSFANTGTLSDP